MDVCGQHAPQKAWLYMCVCGGFCIHFWPLSIQWPVGGLEEKRNRAVLWQVGRCSSYKIMFCQSIRAIVERPVQWKHTGRVHCTHPGLHFRKLTKCCGQDTTSLARPYPLCFKVNWTTLQFRKASSTTSLFECFSTRILGNPLWLPMTEFVAMVTVEKIQSVAMGQVCPVCCFGQ